MAYLGDSPDNNRKLRAGSPAGDPQAAEGSHEVALSKEARQALPEPGLHNDGQYDVGKPTGEKALNAQGLGDPTSRQAVPNPDFSGDVPQVGQVGEAVDFDSVAPYHYPEFPEASAVRTRLKQSVPGQPF